MKLRLVGEVDEQVDETPGRSTEGERVYCGKDRTVISLVVEREIMLWSGRYGPITFAVALVTLNVFF